MANNTFDSKDKMTNSDHKNRDEPQPFEQAEAPKTAQQRHLDFVVRRYVRWKPENSIVRYAHDDAAHMCDAIAADILRERTVRGKVTKEGTALAKIASRCANAIWAMRDEVSK